MMTTSAPIVTPEPVAQAGEAPRDEPPILLAAASPDIALAAVEPAAPATIEVPVYPTRLPPPLHWAYELRYGLFSGRGDLRWALDGKRYEASLEGRAIGMTILDWVSRGAIDAAGAAPERFVIRKRGREQLAANFQRQKGKITYSGTTTEHPLPAGTQDRLSFLLQLPAIVDADPQRFAQPQARIALFVSGARGDADVWHFEVVGTERVDTALGPAQALHLRREPREPRDTRVDVWLDPQRHHLPVRAMLANAAGGPALELLLSDENPSS